MMIWRNLIGESMKSRLVKSKQFLPKKFDNTCALGSIAMADLRMSPTALKELKEAINWYSRRSSQAESSFARAVDAAMNAIEANPLQFASLNSRYRYVRVQGFPYYLAYIAGRRRI